MLIRRASYRNLKRTKRGALHRMISFMSSLILCNIYLCIVASHVKTRSTLQWTNRQHRARSTASGIKGSFRTFQRALAGSVECLIRGVRSR